MRQDGFTLIEAIVAIAILGIVMAAILSMLPGLATTNARTRDEQRVLLSAKAYFESVRSEMQSNFDMDPTTLTVPGVGTGLACTKSAPTVVQSEPAGSTVAANAVLKRISLSCTINGKTYPFSLDVARPL